MKTYLNGLCSLILAAGLMAAAIDSEANGPGAVEVVTVDTHGNTSAYLAALEPLVNLLREFSPEARLEVLEATFAGNDTGLVYIMIRYPDMTHLAKANVLTSNSDEWARAVRQLEATGRTLRGSEILRDRTPD